MKYAPFAAVLLAAALSVRADAPSATIKATDAKALAAVPADQEVTVEGTVAKAAWSKSGKVCSIDFESGESDAKFMGVVFEKSKAKFDEAFGGDFTKQFAGATVRLTGKVADYAGKASKYEGFKQMILSQTGQVTVVTPAASQPTTAPAM